MLDGLVQLLVDFVNGFISVLASTIGLLLYLLPPSPFTFVSSLDSQWLLFANYFFPVAELVALIEIWLTAVTAWYVVRYIARWVKASAS